MTNCPNCGAPYAPGKPVCEYCGTVREGRRMILNGRETLGGAVRYRKVSCGRDVHTGEVYWVTLKEEEII